MLNKEAAQAEASRLLGLVVLPRGSAKLATSPPSILSGPAMGIPGTTSLIDDTAFWQIPMSMSQTLAWFSAHHPGDLPWGGTGWAGDRGITSEGYSYEAPDSAAWIDAAVEVNVTEIAVNTSGVRGDGMAAWIDPVPYSDNPPGPRMRVKVTGGCPASDQGYVGVTNPPPPLDSSLLPHGVATGGLACAYYGGNGKPFALKSSTVMDAATAEGFAVKLKALRVGHLDGEVLHCPMDDGSVTAVALTYAGCTTVDLWMAGGCAETSNGYIRVDGSASV
jgi:hypothetical protein